MSRQYPIWNDVTACIYQSGKSYGVKKEGCVSVKVGTSARNSHNFLNHRVTHRDFETHREYRFYVDDVCIKTAILKKGESELQVTSALNQIKQEIVQ